MKGFVSNTKTPALPEGVREMAIDYTKLPEHIRDSVQRYIETGCPVGSFLTAVISNDLCSAFACADSINSTNMQRIVGFFYNEAPSTCWGSPEKMNAWIEHHQKERERIKQKTPNA